MCWDEDSRLSSAGALEEAFICGGVVNAVACVSEAGAVDNCAGECDCAGALERGSLAWCRLPHCKKLADLRRKFGLRERPSRLVRYVEVGLSKAVECCTLKVVEDIRPGELQRICRGVVRVRPCAREVAFGITFTERPGGGLLVQ